MLIVTEGTVTETTYFEQLKNKLRLRTADIKIVPGKSSAPKEVARTADRIQSKEKEMGEKYDEVFCVIDRDSHANQNFNAACQIMRDNQFENILSIPCIEYWFLLHFCYTRAPYDKKRGKSAAEICEQGLKKYIKNYKKNMPDIFDLLFDKLKTAKKNAQKACQEAETTDEHNPSTKIHILIDKLEKMAKR